MRQGEPWQKLLAGAEAQASGPMVLCILAMYITTYSLKSLGRNRAETDVGAFLNGVVVPSLVVLAHLTKPAALVGRHDRGAYFVNIYILFTSFFALFTRLFHHLLAFMPHDTHPYDDPDVARAWLLTFSMVVRTVQYFLWGSVIVRMMGFRVRDFIPSWLLYSP